MNCASLPPPLNPLNPMNPPNLTTDFHSKGTRRRQNTGRTIQMTEGGFFFAFGHFQQTAQVILFLSVVGVRPMLALVMFLQYIGWKCCRRIQL